MSKNNVFKGSVGDDAGTTIIVGNNPCCLDIYQKNDSGRIESLSKEDVYYLISLLKDAVELMKEEEEEEKETEEVFTRRQYENALAFLGYRKNEEYPYIWYGKSDSQFSVLVDSDLDSPVEVKEGRFPGPWIREVLDKK